MKPHRSSVSMLAPLAAIAVCAHAQIAEDADPPLVTIDHFVSHISTVPANAGDYVKLFVREKFRSLDPNPNLPTVLMIHGAGVGAVPVFDLQFENYSWMDFLANAGFDVFALDLTGYGRSPRPMMDDPCNASASDQKTYLIPNPLAQTCPPTYPFNLTSVQSDWDEIDTVVNYIIQRRQVDRVNLAGMVARRSPCRRLCGPAPRKSRPPGPVRAGISESQCPR